MAAEKQECPVTQAADTPSSAQREWESRTAAGAAAIERDRDAMDDEVENALYRLAVGYDYTEEKSESTEKGGTKTVVTVKHVPPSTTAQLFWLKNRRPDRWRDKQVEQPADEPFEVNVQVIE